MTMGDYRSYDVSDMDEGTQMQLGRVFVSTDAQRFLDAMTNCEGEFQLRECIKKHAVHGGFTKHHVGDVLYLETDVTGRTFVWIQSERDRPPVISSPRKEVKEVC